MSIRKGKYYKVNFPFGDHGVTEIIDDDELELWFKDGSLEKGDYVIQAVHLFIVDEDKKIMRYLRPSGETANEET